MTTLSEGIDRYLEARAPKEWHKAEVRQHRERVREIIGSKHRLMGFFQSGSFQHGTAVMPYSDVDYIARIHYEDRPQSSNTILNNLRDLLRSELWEATVTVSRPAVTLNFPGLLPYYEITPAYLERGTTDEDRVLLIPAPGGGWREAAPQAHNKIVASLDRQHDGDVRETARLLKAWKYQHSVSISSFYLEMRAAEFAKNHDTVYPFTAVRSIVTTLVNQGLPAMNDPARLVARISPCSGESARASAMADLRRFKKSIDAAHSAWLTNDRWEMNEALQAIWGSDFPYSDT
ncbi:nucleotidyltransferase domain-containing protein [Nocardioides yefusunii]|uniref:Nucleotidyltransferase n=1 Tax=Nocardioides yefusunii TaxID=2500546 RepID=A0ABW1QZH0_9ACTN|nr:nucleotidyltransferase [Nocardioides yefusunii]